MVQVKAECRRKQSGLQRFPARRIPSLSPEKKKKKNNALLLMSYIYFIPYKSFIAAGCVDFGCTFWNEKGERRSREGKKIASVAVPRLLYLPNVRAKTA